MIEISIAIPVFNEQDNIRLVVAKTIETLSISGISNYEIILINDGSTDNSGDIIDSCVSAYSSVKSFSHKKNQGLGAALRTGLMASNGLYWTFLPSDGELNANELVKLYLHRGGNSLALGERSLTSSAYRVVRPWYRELLSSLNVNIIKLFIGIDFKGNESIYLGPTDFLKSLKLRSNTGLFNLEIIYWCEVKKINILRIPIIIYPRLSGSSKIMNLRGILKQMFETILIGIFLRTKMK